MICAICTTETETKPEDLDGKTIQVCNRCRSEHPRDGGYSFSESSPSPIAQRDCKKADQGGWS
jgi:ribosome-binding protein aMBF1 (putative translation factor)